VSFIGDLEGLVHPGGDPEAILAAATATRKLASGLQETAKALDSVAAKLEDTWRGTGRSGDDSAAATYQKAWGQFSSATVEFAKQMGPAADSIDTTAKVIQTAQAQGRKLEWMLGLTAVAGIGLTFFTFGISDATADAMAANEIAVAVEVMTALEGIVANGMLVLGEVTEAVITVASQFVLGVLSDGAAIVIEKVKDGLNPWTMTSWTADDISNVLLGGVVSGGLGAAFNGIPALSAFQASHPLVSAGAWGATGAFTWAVPWEFWIQGKSLGDMDTWGAVLASTATSFVSAPLLAKGGDLPGVAGKIMAPKGESPIPGVTWSDVANNVYVIPITGEKLILFTGGAQPAPLSGPDLGKSSDVPGLPAAQAPATPPHIGGQPLTTAEAQSQYEAELKNLGNSEPYPVLPAGSTAHAVQSGQSLWEIAGGDPALLKQIAELNNIPDTSLIYPGQTIILPPAG
jgi:uncharacterized protein YukE